MIGNDLVSTESNEDELKAFGANNTRCSADNPDTRMWVSLTVPPEICTQTTGGDTTIPIAIAIVAVVVSQNGPV